MSQPQIPPSPNLLLTLDIKTGLFSQVPVTDIPPGGCQEIRNMVIEQDYLKARPGLDDTYPILGTNIAIYHLDWFPDLTGTTYLMAVGRHTGTGALSFYYYNSGGGTWSNITGAVSITGVTSNIPHSCNFKGYWFFVDGGAGDLVGWSGTGNCSFIYNLDPDLSPHKKPKVVFSYASHLFLCNIYDEAGTTRIPYRIDWSDFMLYDTWNGGVGAGSSKYQDLLTESDPIITGYATKDLVAIFKPTKIYASTATSAPTYFEFRKLQTDKGCIAPRTLKYFKDALLFLGDDNIYALTGTQVQEVGNNITYRMKQMFSASNLSLSMALLDREKSQYHLFLPKIGTDDPLTFFTLDLRSGAWTESEIANPLMIPTSTVENRTGNWATSLLVGSEDTFIYTLSPAYTQDSSGTTVDTIFYPYWVSGIIDVYKITEGKARTALLEEVEVEAASGRVSLDVATGMRRNTIWPYEFCGELNLSIKDGPNAFSVRQESRYFKLKITYTDHTNWPEISKLYLHFRPKQMGTTNA